jgi:hypothetical protein
MCNIPAGHESFYKLAGRLIQGVKLRVVRNLGDLDSHQMAALTECVGTSALPVFRERLSKGVELHMLLSENRVVGTVFFVLGKSHSFQHIPLTERDAMGLDGRIDPAFRGRGLYPILLLVSLLDFKNRGIERVYTDCAEWNKETIRSFECVGFRYLLKYRLRRGFYRFEQEVF